MRLDPATAPSGFDAGTVSSVELAAVSGSGRLWLVDVAATQPQLPVVDDGRRLPVLALAPRTRVDEGDGPTGTARVRWSVDEPAAREAHAVVVVLSYGKPRTQTPVRFTIPAGATTGTVRIPYPADDRAGTIHSTMRVFPADGVVVTRPFASLVVRDDD